MVEFRPLVGDVSGRELRLDSCEPDEWVSGPVGQNGGILIDTEATVAGTGCGGFLLILGRSWTLRETSVYCVRGRSRAESKLHVQGHQI